jgi:hypothetical protein
MQISGDMIQMCTDYVRVEAAINAARRWARVFRRRLRPPSVSALVLQVVRRFGKSRKHL